MTKTRLWQKVFILVFKMPEDIKIKDDQPIRTYEKVVNREFVSMNIKGKKSSVFGITFPDWRETYGWKFAFNMAEGIKFDLEPKMIRKLNYRTKFHNFVMNIGQPIAWHSYYMAGSARINIFMFDRKIDMQHCIDYFENDYYPRWVIKNNKTTLQEALDMLKMSQGRVEQVEQEIANAKKILSAKKK